ncbi:MAG: rhomboid family intramembrane serine protease [Acidobacteriota bacterium]|nr:rhomboid family intramembrane serine protease [Acidobacteriota bacterium]
MEECNLDRAISELDEYRLESVSTREESIEPPLSGGWIGVLAYTMLLVVVAFLAQRNALGVDWFERGRTEAGSMLAGEGWRAVTALTLHIDGSHLLGNLLFGSILGLLATQALGVGVTWLAIVVGGILGNVANAFLQPATHSSIGASTAVFAALGLLVALALVHSRHRRVGAWKLGPLVAGALLLAWTGIGGERTDVLAHVTGLISGLMIGVACGFVPRNQLERPLVQSVALGLTAGLIVVAWGLALG